MGACLTTHNPNDNQQSALSSMIPPQPTEGAQVSTPHSGAGASGPDAVKKNIPSDVNSTASSDIPHGAPRGTEGSRLSLDPTAPSSEDSRTQLEPGTSPKYSSLPGSPGLNNPPLTESALRQLNQSSMKKGKPSSTGGTTANTRPTDLPDVPEAGPVEIPEPELHPHTEHEDDSAQLSVPEEMPLSTPPPVPEGLPVVSLQDIVTMEQNKGLRGRRVKSRRGSTTASHASLSAIPENVEITPLHARSERSDSMRVGQHSGHPLNRLAEVLELDSEGKNVPVATRLDSPRSSSSVLTSGDDSVMPHQILEHDYDMHMPLFGQPRAYWRCPNATEAIRASAQQGSGRAPGTPTGRPPLYQHSSGANSTALAAPSAPSSECGFGERVLTDDSGLQLLGSTITVDGSRRTELSKDDLRLTDPDPELEEDVVSIDDCEAFQQGTRQQETIRFSLPEPVEGLRCVKKYAVGELCWEQVVVMGDYDAGEHSFEFAESSVPKGSLTVGQYRMKTVFMDMHGQYLWAGLHNFKVVKPE